MSNYVNINKLNLPMGGSESVSSGVFGSIKNFTSNLSTTNILIIIGILAFIGIGLYYYYYHVVPMMSPTYKSNSEKMTDSNGSKQYAEIMLFYADWCPHCKTAKPIWNEMKSKYQDKIINGYTVVFTEINCTEESAEVNEMMDKYNIEGFPTIKMLKNGQIVEFDANPTKQNIEQFITTVI